MDWVNELRAALATEFGERPRVCTLASMDDDGRAAARSVICRRVEAGGELLFTSDARSRKNDQLRDRPGAEVVFWLERARVQYRLSGDAGVVRAGVADELRAQVWRELSDATRATFYWPASGEAFDAAARFEEAVGAEVAPPVTFELLILRPAVIDVLELRGVPHVRRMIERAEGGWVSRRVNP